MNFGVKRRRISKKDWRVGGETGIEYKVVLPTGDWTPYLPAGEKQSGNIDSMSCVTFAALNSLETQIKYLLVNNKIPQTTIDWLTANKYLVDGEVNFSDRFTSVMSGTTQGGNWNTAVWESIRKDGLLPESMCPSNFTSWADWSAPISAENQFFAKEILKHFNISYMWVESGKPTDEVSAKQNLSNWLKVAPLNSDVPICSGWWTGLVSACGSRATQHCIEIYKIGE